MDVEFSINSELNNEFEAMHFGFSPAGFVDSVYNLLTESWGETVEEVILKHPKMQPVCKNKQFRKSSAHLLSNLGKKKYFETMMKEFKKFCLLYVFRIPKCVTLPVHRPCLKWHARILNATVEEKKALNLSNMEKKNRKGEKDIIQKRVLLQKLEEEIDEANRVIEIMEEMEKLLEKKHRLSLNTTPSIQEDQQVEMLEFSRGTEQEESIMEVDRTDVMSPQKETPV